jgi:hypothetical protein
MVTNASCERTSKEPAVPVMFFDLELFDLFIETQSKLVRSMAFETSGQGNTCTPPLPPLFPGCRKVRTFYFLPVCTYKCWKVSSIHKFMPGGVFKYKKNLWSTLGLGGE